MSQSEILHFNPPPLAPEPGNNPAAANSARQKIAGLADQYGSRQAPASKEELAASLTPISPAAQEVPLTAGLPMVSDFVIRSGSPGGTTRSRPARLPSRLKPLVTGVITFLLLFTIFKSPILLSQLGYATHSGTPAQVNTAAATAVSPDPTISIPKISVNAPVVYATNNAESAIQTDLESGVVHYADTAVPGQPGNNVIFGHSSNDWWEPGNYKFVFVLLDKLVPGDTMTINYQSKQYLYQVTSTEVVAPTDVGVLAPTATPTLTLITCTPPGTSWKRLIVQAKQLTPVTTAVAQTTTPTTATPGTTLPSNSPDFLTQLSNFWKGITSSFSGGGKTASPPTTLPQAK